MCGSHPHMKGVQRWREGGLAGDMAPPPTWHHIIPLPHYLASYKTLSYISPKRTHREVHFEREILHM